MIKIMCFWRSLFSRYRKAVLIIGTFAAAAMFAVAISISAVWLTDNNAPLAFIKAQTELVNYIVARPELSSIPLYEAEIVSKGDQLHERLKENNGLFTGLFKPMAGVRITYRHGGEKVIIEIKPGPMQKRKAGSILGHLIFYNDTRCAIRNRLVIRFRTPTSEESFSNNTRPLPIAGPAEIGRELGIPLMPGKNGKRSPGLMAGGTIRIFGRTNSKFGDKEVYPAQNASFLIPKGSRLTSMSNSSVSAGSPNSWYGSASIGKAAFELFATTESKELRLYQPGRSRDAERFNISLFVQIFNDPSFASWFFGFVIFTFFLRMILSLFKVFGLPIFTINRRAFEPLRKKKIAESSYLYGANNDQEAPLPSRSIDPAGDGKQETPAVNNDKTPRPISGK